MQKHPSRRTLVVIVLSLTGILASAAGAFAWHGACPTNAPNLDPRPGKKTYVSTATTSSSYSVCFSANDPDANGGCGAVANKPEESAICGGVTLTLGDPNPASIGRTVAVDSGTTLTGEKDVGPTGAEAGSTSGTMVSGGTVHANGSPVNLNVNGARSNRPAGVTTGPNTPICVGTCVFVPGPPYKVDSGYDVYVLAPNSNSPTLKGCVSIGTSC